MLQATNVTKLISILALRINSCSPEYWPLSGKPLAPSSGGALGFTLLQGIQNFPGSRPRCAAQFSIVHVRMCTDGFEARQRLRHFV